MNKPLRYTHHARQKFNDLAQMGFPVTEAMVEDTVRQPDMVDTNEQPPIAQKALTDRHLLRVVFEEEPEVIRIITFYPGRRDRYEPKNAL